MCLEMLQKTFILTKLRVFEQQINDNIIYQTNSGIQKLYSNEDLQFEQVNVYYLCIIENVQAPSRNRAAAPARRIRR